MKSLDPICGPPNCRPIRDPDGVVSRPVAVALLELALITLGALFMHFMLETILTGRLMKIDPFNQPAVEEGKILARQYLEERKA